MQEKIINNSHNILTFQPPATIFKAFLMSAHKFIYSRIILLCVQFLKKNEAKDQSDVLEKEIFLVRFSS